MLGKGPGGGARLGRQVWCRLPPALLGTACTSLWTRHTRLPCSSPQVYRRAGLLREAVALASARLLPGYPLLQVRCSGLEWAGPRAVR